MKKLILPFILLLIAGTAFSQTKVYYEIISNDSKTIDYTIGVYPGSYEYKQPDNVTPYSMLTMRVVNNGSDVLYWNEHNRIFILLKDGTMICNYKTVAQDGRNANGYTVYKGEKHEQDICFGEKFDISDIEKVFIYDASHDQIFSLMYDVLTDK